MIHAVYPGSFDPLHNGHLDVIRRATRIFGRLTVAVLQNPGKRDQMFSSAERLEIIRRATAGMEHVNAESFDGLLAEYMRISGADVIVKGLRALPQVRRAESAGSLRRGMETVGDLDFIVAATEIAAGFAAGYSAGSWRSPFSAAATTTTTLPCAKSTGLRMATESKVDPRLRLITSAPSSTA